MASGVRDDARVRNIADATVKEPAAATGSDPFDPDDSGPHDVPVGIRGECSPEWTEGKDPTRESVFL
jgi:hypothetical protein